MTVSPAVFTDAVLSADLPAGTKVVAIYIARRVGRNGTAWPHLATIAADVRMSERNAMNAIGLLEEAGWLSLARPSAADRAKRKPTHYTLALPQVKPASGVAEPSTGSTVQVEQANPASGAFDPSTGSGLPKAPEVGFQKPPSHLSLKEPEKLTGDPRGSLARRVRQSFVVEFERAHATTHGGPQGTHLVSILDAAEADADPADFVDSAVRGFFASQRMAAMRPPHPVRFFADDVASWAAEGRRGRALPQKYLAPDEAAKRARAEIEERNAAWRARRDGAA